MSNNSQLTLNMCRHLLPGMKGCHLLHLLTCASLSLQFVASTGIHPAIDGQCKKVVVFFALQTTTIDGQGASYLGESSLKYQQHLKVALMSIRQNCPSLRPVVVSMYPVPKLTIAWIKSLGAEFMIHELTFSKDVLETAQLPDYAWVKGVVSTYLRTEVKSRCQSTLRLSAAVAHMLVIVACLQVHMITAEYILLTNGEKDFDLTYVIWGDLDTIWMKDFNSCSLAKPTILSVSG